MSQGRDSNRRLPRGQGPQRSLLSPEALTRLEGVADLHRAAASPRTALEYLHRALVGLDTTDPDMLPVAVRLHRKTADAALDLGDLATARTALAQAAALLPELTDDHTHRILQATLRSREAVLLAHQRDYRGALAQCRHAFAELAVTDHHREVANVLATMGVCHHRLGRLDKAREYYADALASYRRARDLPGEISQLNNLALLEKNACRWERARDLLVDALNLANGSGATHLQCRLLLNLGIVHLKRGATAEARPTLEKGWQLARGLGDRDRETKFLLVLGALETAEGNLLRAEEQLLAGKSQADELGFRRESIIADEYLGDLQLVRGDPSAALANYQAGLARLPEQDGASDLAAELQRRVATALLARGKTRQALAAADRALAAAEAAGERFELGFCHLVRGRALLRLGRPDAGWRALKLAARTFREQHLPGQEAVVVTAAAAAAARTERPSHLLSGWSQRVEELLERPEALRGDRQRLELLLARTQLLVARRYWDEALLCLGELEQALAGQPDRSLNAAVTGLRRRLDEVLDSSYSGGREHRSLPDLVLLLQQPGVNAATLLSQALDLALASLGRGGRGCLLAVGSDPEAAWTVLAHQGLTREEAQALAACVRRCLGRELARPAVLRRERLAACPGDLAGGEGQVVLHLPVGQADRLQGALLLLPSGTALPDLPVTLERLGSIAALLAGRLPEPAGGRESASQRSGFGAEVGFLTRDRGVQQVLELARTVAASELTVMLQGETGTGKGLLARAIHAASPRRRAHFLSVNCAAIPESLLESELFGHVRGSFTGAVSDKKGLLEEADGGTVFLDEIGKLPLSMQGKLLHFLDTRRVRPVGSNQSRAVDVRILCATKTDLARRVQEGSFLEDLYYRLSDFPLVLPPLRERRIDLPLLARHFVTRYARRVGIDPPGLSRAFLTALERYAWPGNIRELEKVLVRAVVLARGASVLTPELLPFDPPPAAPPEGAEIRPLRDSLQRVERREIARALAATGGNKSAAARLLRISYPSLLKKIRQYDLAGPSKS